MTRTKGIYIFSLTPFRQRAFAGFGKEIMNLAKLHWTGVAYFAAITGGALYLKSWANDYYIQSERKNPNFYDQEYAQLAVNRSEEEQAQ
jgi:hypothetical protein